MNAEQRSLKLPDPLEHRIELMVSSPKDEPTLLSLRERKKAKTREAIQREALRLFSEHGYDETTIEQIAAAADLAVRTFAGAVIGAIIAVYLSTDETSTDLIGLLDVSLTELEKGFTL